MKISRLFISLFFLSALTACLQTENSSSQDKELYAQGDETPQFAAAKAIFGACFPCHSYGAMNEQAFITQGLAIPGNVEGSKIYYRLIGSAGPGNPKDMPTTGALSVDQVATVAAWIASIAP